VFVPLSDDNPWKSIPLPFVTIALILVNVVVFVMQVTGGATTGATCRSLAGSFAIIPADLFGVRVIGGAARGPCDAWAVPEWLTLVTYAFMHGDPLHLIGNMLFLWVFGDNVEDALGHPRFLAFYLLTAVAGGLAHAIATDLLSPANRDVALIGASGAVAGVIMAYLLLYPHVRVWVLAFRFIPLRISAMFALGVWVATQFVMLLLPDTGPIAWWAHVGGLLAGGILVVVMRRPGVELFNAALVENEKA
jgi:membrane associated rhomboid family serine protease